MINLLASEKSLNESMVINLCFLFKGSVSDREIGPFCRKNSVAFRISG